MVEGGGFEPPRPFGIRRAEFGASLAHHSARKKCLGAAEIFRLDSALLPISLFFGSLCCCANRRRYRTSVERLKFESPLLGGQSTIQLRLLPRMFARF